MLRGGRESTQWEILLTSFCSEHLFNLYAQTTKQKMFTDVQRVSSPHPPE